MAETTWVRSIYLYAMCLVSFALLGLGSVTAVGGLVHTVAPDLGHRDTLDRIGIGVSNIADEIIDLVSQVGLDQAGAEDFCRDVTDNTADFDDCVANETGGEQIDAIKDGVSKVRNEFKTQIRNSAIDQLIRGLLMAAAGFVLLRIHGSRTDLFADGVIPKKPQAPMAAPPTATMVAPAASPMTATAPPPPGAPPPPDQETPPTASF